MRERIFVICVAILLLPASGFGDAFYSSAVNFNLTFPNLTDLADCPGRSWENCFGYAGPKTAFDPQGGGGHLGTQTGSYPTYTVSIQASGLATPENTISGSNAATMSSRLGNLTGSGGPTPSGRTLNITFGYSYTFVLEALADTVQDTAAADLFIRVRAGGSTPAGWTDVTNSISSSDTLNGMGAGNFTVSLPANSVTPLLVMFGVAGTATSLNPPVIPPPPPPPPEPPYPPDPIPEPSLLAPVAGALSVLIWKRRRG